MADEPATKVKTEGNWTVDVQRGLAWTIVLVFGALLLAMAIRVIVSGEPTDSLELLKQGVNALINIVMMVMGFFFGSSKSSQSKDEVQAKVIENLTPPTGTGNGAPEGDAMRAAVAAAAMAAPAAAAVAAPAAAAVAAPPAADIAAPPVVAAEVAEVVPREVAKQVAAAVAASNEVEKQK